MVPNESDPHYFVPGRRGRRPADRRLLPPGHRSDFVVASDYSFYDWKIAKRLWASGENWRHLVPAMLRRRQPVVPRLVENLGAYLQQQRAAVANLAESLGVFLVIDLPRFARQQEPVSCFCAHAVL